MTPDYASELQRAAGNASVRVLIEQAMNGAVPPALQRADSTEKESPSGAKDVPENAEAVATSPTVSYGPNARASDVTSYSLSVLRDVLVSAELDACTISSTARDATNQARVMYDNLEALGAAHQKRLYGVNGEKVIDVYLDGKAAKDEAATIKAAMVAKIVELGPTKVSRHATDPAVLNVFDVSPSSIQDARRLVDAVNKEKRVSNFLQPPADPGFHFEIPQVG